jgi:hypothetical protein
MHFREQAEQDGRDFRWWESNNARSVFRFLPRPAEAALKVDAAHAQFCLFVGRADSRRLRGVASVTLTASGFRVHDLSA